MTNYQEKLKSLILEAVDLGNSNAIVVYQYLLNFEPATSIDDVGAYLHTTDAICYDLSELLDLELSYVSNLMINAGYSIACDKKDDYVPGWLMKRV
ncbi:MAG: hypothetical protein RSA66_06205 [Muribaculaceae bacterium]